MKDRIYTNCRSCGGTGLGGEGDPRCLDCEMYRRIDREEKLVPMHHHPMFRATTEEMKSHGA